LVDFIMLASTGLARPSVSLNLGPDDSVSVREIQQIVCSVMQVEPIVSFGATPEGWDGDVPRYAFSRNGMIELGWNTRLTSQQAVSLAARQIYDELTST